jgi:hypothetical protein
MYLRAILCTFHISVFSILYGYGYCLPPKGKQDGSLEKGMYILRKSETHERGSTSNCNWSKMAWLPAV